MDFQPSRLTLFSANRDYHSFRLVEQAGIGIRRPLINSIRFSQNQRSSVSATA